MKNASPLTYKYTRWLVRIGCSPQEAIQFVRWWSSKPPKRKKTQTQNLKKIANKDQSSIWQVPDSWHE